MKLLKVTPLNRPAMYINPTYLISLKPHGNHGCDLRIFGESMGAIASTDKIELVHIRETVEDIMDMINPPPLPPEPIPLTEALPLAEEQTNVFSSVTDNWVTNGISGMFSRAEPTASDDELVVVDLDTPTTAQPGVIESVVGGISDYFKSEPVEDIPGAVVVYDPNAEDAGIISSMTSAASSVLSGISHMFSPAEPEIPVAKELTREEKISKVKADRKSAQ